MNRLQFIGTGSAFNTKLGNTSACIREKDSMLLIDCGGTVFHRLMELGLLEGVKQLNIIITHTHPDHVGSLGDVIFYTHFVLKIMPKVYFPNAQVLKTYLDCVGVESNIYELIDKSEVNIAMELSNIDVAFMPAAHLPTVPAYSFIISNKACKTYYSGDSNSIPEGVIKMLTEGDLDYIYQDTCGYDYERNPHLSFRKLCEVIPKHLRERVTCIHHDHSLDLEKLKAEGFQLPSVL